MTVCKQHHAPSVVKGMQKDAGTVQCRARSANGAHYGDHSFDSFVGDGSPIKYHAI